MRQDWLGHKNISPGPLPSLSSPPSLFHLISPSTFFLWHIHFALFNTPDIPHRTTLHPCHTCVAVRIIRHFMSLFVILCLSSCIRFCFDKATLAKYHSVLTSLVSSIFCIFPISVFVGSGGLPTSYLYSISTSWCIF